jgi:Dolichyl-phosphate-mannose-protein mannosyltransferase
MSSTVTYAPHATAYEKTPWLKSTMALIWAIALAKFLFHLYYNNRYGYFRDEFDYIACGNHLAWGYVDQPPLIPFLIHVCRAIFGDSLRSIRLIPALVSSLLVVQTALIARELDGSRFAQILSAICIVIAPQYLSNAGLLGTNCLEPNLWMACAYFAILAIKRNQPHYWLWFGVAAGIGLEEKYTIALFGFAVVVGLVLTAERRFLRDKWIWIGGLAAFAIFLPNLLWNIHYHWPFLELMHNIRAEGRDIVLGPLDYFVQQTLIVHPFTAPIWLAGLGAFFFSARLKPYRLLGWAYIVCYAVLYFLHGKNYYLAPVYPMLLAAGSVVIDGALTHPHRGWLKPVIAVLLLAAGAHLAPITVPVFSPERFLAYEKTLPFKLPVMEHAHERAALPQWYADQFGWQEIVDEAAVAWSQVPAAERNDCAIFAQDYGQAGAIDFLGRRYGLPPAISTHQTYWLWGPRNYSGKCMIILGDHRNTLEQDFADVHYVGDSQDNPYAMETGIAVWICHGPKFGALADLWPKLKKWR